VRKASESAIPRDRRQRVGDMMRTPANRPECSICFPAWD
jgi:hypothetical protein